MGRKKIEIKRIKDDRNRSVTFLKRKNGLMKKAMELSILCDCQIGLIIFNAQGKLFKYASDGNLDGLIARAEAHNDNFEDKKNQDLQEMILRKEREREAKEREKAMGNSTMIITRTPQSYMNGSTSKAFNANNNNNNNSSSSSSNNNNNNNNNSNTNGSYSSGTSDDEYIPPHQAVPPQQQPHPLPVHQQRHPHHTQPHHPPPHPHQQHPYGHPRHMQQQPYHSHPHHQQHQQQQQPYPNMHPNMPQHHPHHQQQHQHQQQNYYTASGLGLTNNLDLYNNLTPRSAAQVDSINKAFQNYSNHSVKQESPANSMVAHAAHQVHPQHAMVHPVQGYGGYNNVPNNMPYHANPAMDEPDPKRRRKDTFSRLRVAIPQEGEAGIAAMGMPPAANGVVATGPQQQGPLLSASSTSSTSTADEQFEQFQQQPQPQPPQQQQQYTNRPPMPQQPWISTTQGETPVTTAAVTMSTTTTTTTTSKFVYPSPYVSNSAAPMMDHNNVAQGQPFNAPGNPLSTPSSLLSPGALDTPGKIGLMPSPFLPDMSSENNPFPDTPMTMTTPRSFWGNSSKLLGIEGGLVGSSGELGTPSGIVPDVANQLSMLSGQKNPMLERFGNGGNRRSYNSLLSPIMNNHAPAPTSTAITLSSSSNSCQNNNNTNNNDAIITSTTTTTMPTTATTSPTAAAATTTK